MLGLQSDRKHLRELIQSLVVEQGRKVVVFSQWRRMLSLAHWSILDILEGGVLTYGSEPDVKIRKLSATAADFRVRWSPRPGEGPASRVR